MNQEIMLDRIGKLERELNELEQAYTDIVEGLNIFDIMSLIGCSEEQAVKLYQIKVRILDKLAGK